MASRRRHEADEEYELDEYPDSDSVGAAIGKRLAQFVKESGGPPHNFVFEPDGIFYKWWTWFILVWATYSSFFTPFEFGFYRGLPNHLWALDVTAQVIFLGDVFVQFFLAFRDAHKYTMVYDRRSIALRYAKSSFVPDLLACLPWDIIYKAAGGKEELRYMLWIRLYRVRKLEEFLQKLEKDIRINYLFTRIMKLLFVELYCTHTAACIFYYLATTLPESKEGFTWIGSLTLGDYNYNDFREISVMRRYLTSLYFAIVTMATVGYGDIHAVNSREMIFIMIYVSFDMIIGAYLIGNMTALIVKGSKTERFRDKMTDLIKYMNRNKIGKDIRTQIKGHVRLQYESSYGEASALQNIPISIRAKVSQSLYMSEVEKVPLFKGCSSEFISQIVTRLHEEFFLPGEIIMEQGYAVDQLYIVSNGSLEELTVLEGGLEDTVARLEAHDIFGEIAVLCNIPQPYTVRVCELCRLLRLEKESFVNILQLYFKDGRQILTNLLEGKDINLRTKQLKSDIALLIAKQEAELALQINSAAYNGDLYRLKSLIRASAVPTQMDYDGRTALHLAASKGYEEIAMSLIQAGADVNYKDRFGNTPLLEAVKSGHDRISSLLTSNGASLILEDAGGFLCKVVANGNMELLKRLLDNGVDPNSKDYNHQTPLHMAAAEGLHLLAKILLESGASVFVTDRWGNTPLDEGRKCGSKPLIQLLEEAQAIQITKGCATLNPPTDTPEGQVSSYNSIPCSECVRNSDLPEGTHSKIYGRNVSQPGDKKNKTCTLFPFHPWIPREKRRHGLVMWVPQTIEALLHSAAEHFGFHGTYILTEDAGKILHVDLIQDSQRLYVVNEDEVPES